MHGIIYIKGAPIPYNSEFAGLGVFIEKKKSATYFGHNGWDEGFCALKKAHRD